MSSPLFVAISEYQSTFVWVAGSAFKRRYCGAGKGTANFEAENYPPRSCDFLVLYTFAGLSVDGKSTAKSLYRQSM